MAWNQIVVIVLVLVLIVVIYVVIKNIYEKGSWLLPKSAFEILEKIRCSLKTEPCLSIYPSKVREGEKVFVTIRTTAAYRGKTACFTSIGDCKRNCTIGRHYMCSFNFTASVADSGTYYAFVDKDFDGNFTKGEDPKSDEHDLTVLP